MLINNLDLENILLYTNKYVILFFLFFYNRVSNSTFLINTLFLFK